MSTLRLAQLSDIHLSALGNHHDMLSGETAGMLAEVIARLNEMAPLDGVLVSGDLVDTAAAWEFEQFQQLAAGLKTPPVIIPGNHDRRDADAAAGLTHREFARRFNPQFDQRPRAAAAQSGYWSMAVSEQVQLIGLDSIVDDDWGGLIDAAQLEWLAAELSRHADKLVIVAVHHPLHRLAPIDDIPHWQRFVCANGSAVQALLDGYPQVKLVLTGHHHLTQATVMNGRLHLAGPALATYPCAFRTIQVEVLAGGQHRLAWQTHAAAPPETIARARQLLVDMWTSKAGLPPDFVEEYARLCLGSEIDQCGEFVL
jgi:3',5'-cyclic AMP phosphodiesterase CpdA